MEFEKVFPELCVYGKYQRLIFMFVLLPVQLSYYCHLYSHLFMAYQPQHWCHVSDDHIPTTSVPYEHVPNGLNNTNGIFSAAMLRNNAYLKRYFFAPSVKLFDQIDNSSNLNMLTFVTKLNYSLVNFIDTIGSCHVYNSTFEQLTKYHQNFFQLYSMFTNNGDRTRPVTFEMAPLMDWSLKVPPIVTCQDGWHFNRTLLGHDESIVTKVSQIFNFSPRLFPSKNNLHDNSQNVCRSMLRK